MKEVHVDITARLVIQTDAMNHEDIWKMLYDLSCTFVCHTDGAKIKSTEITEHELSDVITCEGEG